MASSVATKTKSGGYTLIELMISLAVLGIIIAGIFELYTSMRQTWIDEEKKAAAQQEARVAMDNMVRELMMMGYGSNTKILTAKADEIRFEESVLNSAGTAYEPWRITYKIQGNNLVRSSITYDDDVTGLPETVRVLMEGVKSLDFEYYYKDVATPHTVADFQVPWDEADPTTQSLDPGTPQANRDLIRRVTMKLVVASGAKNPDGTDKTITLTADISPRNMWEGEASMDDDPPLWPDDEDGNPVPTVPWIKIRDTEQRNKMKVQWSKSVSPDLAGYLVKYGAVSGTWQNVKDVPASASDVGNPWTYLTDGIDISEYIDEGLDIVKYYVTVQAYDRSYNYTPEGTPVGGADPDTSNTSFDVAVSDATNTIPKPAAPANLAVFNNNTTTGELKLTWTKSSDPNVDGYRIYRSTTAFSTFPVAESKLIASETGVGFGQKLTAATEAYIDSDDDLIGCNTYYYAVCAVTCDPTRIHGFGDATKDATRGGIYTADNYATGYAESKEKVKPSSPMIEARPGWHKVFLDVDFPNEDIDYDYTRIFWGVGTDKVTVTESSPPIPDRQVPGDDAGKFYDQGSSSATGITFNHQTLNIEDIDEPMLQNNMVYSFLAVAYDKCGNKSDTVEGVATTFAKLCGDEPCGAPVLPAGASVSVNPITTTLDTSKWVRLDDADDSQAKITNLGLAWTQVEGKGAYGNDFSGYNVSLEDNPPLVPRVLYPVSNNIWPENTVSSSSSGKPLLEGAAYDYIVQATDCVWQNMTPADTIICITDGLTYTYDEIRANNITPLAVAPKLTNVRPGRVRQFRGTPATDKENYAYASGDYFNRVNFYIQNTSKAALLLDSMKVRWDNPLLSLNAVVIYDNDGTVLLNKAVSALSKTSFNLDNTEINDLATSTIAYSGPMQVQLQFQNTTEPFTSAATDMREYDIGWEMKFKNKSMLTAGLFTTGDIDILEDMRTFRVSGGPRVNTVVQNQPANPTTPLKATDGSPPSLGYVKVDGNIDVTVTANVTRPTGETLSSVKIRYYETAEGAAGPGGDTANFVTMTQTGGNTYTGVIDGSTETAVWYDIVATSDQGTIATSPPLDAEYYYYRTNPFDVCYVTPEAPTNFTATKAGADVTLAWTAPTKYTNGLDKLASDTFVYDIYRRLATGSFPSTAFVAGVTGTSYTTPIGATTYMYAVKARNSCTDSILGPKESVLSNEALVCAGTACTVALSPSSAEMDTNWTDGSRTASITSGNLSVTICDRAGDHFWWFPNTAAGFGTSPLDVSGHTLSDITMAVSSVTSGSVNGVGGSVFNITLYEIDDSGVFTMTGTSDSGIFINPLATPAYNNTWKNLTPVTADSQRTFPATLKATPEDTLYFKTDAGITNCASVLASPPVSVTTSPCANTPAKPVISYIRRVDTGSPKSTTVKCNRITLNTDGSPATTTRDGVTYQIWYAATSETNLANYTLWAPASIVIDTVANKVTFTGDSLGNVDKKFYIRALDNCSPTPNVLPVSAGDVITVLKGGTYGTP